MGIIPEYLACCWNLAVGSTQHNTGPSTGRTRKSEVTHVRQTTFYPDDA